MACALYCQYIIGDCKGIVLPVVLSPVVPLWQPQGLAALKPLTPADANNLQSIAFGNRRPRDWRWHSPGAHQTAYFDILKHRSEISWSSIVGKKSICTNLLGKDKDTHTHIIRSKQVCGRRHATSEETLRLQCQTRRKNPRKTQGHKAATLKPHAPKQKRS